MAELSEVPGAYRKQCSLINWKALCDEGRGGSWLRLRVRLYGGRLCALIDPVGLHEGNECFDVMFFKGRYEQSDLSIIIICPYYESAFTIVKYCWLP